MLGGGESQVSDLQPAKDMHALSNNITWKHSQASLLKAGAWEKWELKSPFSPYWRAWLPDSKATAIICLSEVQGVPIR